MFFYAGIAMHRYKNIHGDSGVLAYESGPDYIKVRFRNGDVYLYTYASAGKENIENMKTLAETGKGLSGYISVHVRDRFFKKL
jgi:hypothetical protein